MTTGARRTCSGTKSNGEPCQSTLGLSPDGLCLNHDPARRDQVQANRAAGGRARGEASRARRAAREALPPSALADAPAMVETLDDAAKALAWIAHAIITKKIDARTGHEASYALNGFKAAAEKRDLEREITELRRQVAEAKTRTMRVS
jgi:hypothetical protein